MKRRVAMKVLRAWVQERHRPETRREAFRWTWQRTCSKLRRFGEAAGESRRAAADATESLAKLLEAMP